MNCSSSNYKMNSSLTANDSLDFFAVVYAKSPLTKFSIATSLVLTFLNIISGFGIIWFEHFGSDQKRTLINRLLTSVCLTGIEFYVIVLPFEIFRHLNGPFDNVTCHFLLLFKNSLSIQYKWLYLLLGFQCLVISTLST